MKSRKKIPIIIIAVVLTVLIIRYIVVSREAEIVRGSTLMEKDASWNVMIANYVNMKNINIIVDGNAGKIDNGRIYMDEKRNIMISYDVLTDLFLCATNRYFNSMLVVEKGVNRLIFTAGSSIMSFNGTDVETYTTVSVVDGRIFVPLGILCQYLNYDYTWNYTDNTINVSNKNPEEKIFPFYYDYRNDGKVTEVKNQTNFGTCWAFASLTALSLSMLPESVYDFSVDNLCYHNGYNLTIDEGGEYTMAMAYLASWKGPVLEEQDPYGDGISPDGIEEAVHVQEMQILESRNFSDIKKSVFLYGGVQSSLYMSLNDVNGNNSQFYNSETNSYYYAGMEKSNHDIVIIGWDDAYPAENFSTIPEGNGAFICVNSWGENFGENGYFYVSYYDSNIGIHNIVYTKIEDKNNYDNIYQSDELGWVGQLGYGADSAYFANVFVPDTNQKLAAVGFYATGEDTEYEIYCVKDFQDINSFSSKLFIAKGSLSNAGYYTIELDDRYIMEAGNKFAVIIYIKTRNSVHPVAIEYNSAITSNAVIDDGEGYISSNGKNWERVEEKYKCNVCLKLYTDNMM